MCCQYKIILYISKQRWTIQRNTTKNSTFKHKVKWKVVQEENLKGQWGIKRVKWYCKVIENAEKRNAMQYIITMPYNAVQATTMQCNDNMMQYNAIKCNTRQ